MSEDTKTVGGLASQDSFDPIDSLKRESIERMRTALLSASLDDPLSAISAMRQVTLLRMYHQVSRIVQYLDIMDKLESKLYEKIDSSLYDLDMSDDSNFATITKLLAIQEKLQKSIVESNKLLAPYLDMEQYPAFNAIEASTTTIPANILELPATQRDALRENAGAIITELKMLQSSNDVIVEG